MWNMFWIMHCLIHQVRNGYTTISSTSGSNSSNVKAVQSALSAKGYYNGDYDGSYGSGTEQAVKDFQKAMERRADTAYLLETEPASATAAEIAEMVAYNELPATGTPGYVYVAVEKDEK